MFDTILDLEPTESALPLPPSSPAEVRDPDRARRLFERVAPPPLAIAPAALPADPVASPAPPPPAFAAIQRRDLGRRASGRAAWAVFAAGLEVIAAGCAAVAAAALTEPPPPELTMVEVKLAAAFPRRPGPGRGPALPAAPAPRRAVVTTASVRPRVPPPAPTALLQPREVPVAMRPPDPGEPVEDVGFAGDVPAGSAGADEGVIGGVVGGEGGGAWGGGASVAAATGDSTSAEPGDGIEDAPVWATAGFRKPVEAVPGCVARAVRLPRELAGFTSGPYVVRFAVLPGGAVERIELLGEVPDARIGAAIAQAVRACRWIPGADAQGHPVSLWVVLPIRFESA